MIIELAAGRSLLSQHAVHALSVGIPVAMVAAGLAVDAVRKSRSRARRQATLARAPLFVAAGASVGAALVHVWVVPAHLAESLLYGAFFAGLAAAQLAAAWLVALSRSRTVIAAVAVGSSAVICLWLVTRLVAIPLGPDAGTAESFGALDVAASAFEALAVVGCVTALWRRKPANATPVPPPAIREQALAR